MALSVAGIEAAAAAAFAHGIAAAAAAVAAAAAAAAGAAAAAAHHGVQTSCVFLHHEPLKRVSGTLDRKPSPKIVKKGSPVYRLH